MSTASKIEWTDATWNPVVGCSIVSPGCIRCYAMRMAARIEAMDKAAGHAPHYRGLTKKTKAGAVWTGVVRLHRPALLAPLTWRKPRRVFVNSMSDLFHEALSDADIDQVFAVMAFSPHCQFQVLTKRADRMRAYFADTAARESAIDSAMNELAPAHWHRRELHDWSDGLPLPNVWLGVSAERQVEADARVPTLLATPAAVRFVSAEPLLGPVVPSSAWHRLNWIIAGGESGPRARPAHPDWFRTLRDACKAAGIAFFFKQWGEWGSGFDTVEDARPFKGDRLRYFPELDRTYYRVGKAVAGAELDGRLHREFPA